MQLPSLQVVLYPNALAAVVPKEPAVEKASSSTGQSIMVNSLLTSKFFSFSISPT